MSLGWLGGAASMDHRLQGPRDASLLTRAQDAHAFDLHAPVALVHDRRDRPVFGKDAHLLERLCQRVAAVRIAGMLPLPTTSPFFQMVAMLSVGGAIVLGVTVVSRMNRSTLDAFTTPPRRAASMVAHQQGLHAFFADALPPTREAAGIGGRLGLEVRLAAEVLPVRILDPGGDHRLVGGVEGVLQVQQAGDEPRRQCRSTSCGIEVGAECARDLGLVDQALPSAPVVMV